MDKVEGLLRGEAADSRDYEKAGLDYLFVGRGEVDEGVAEEALFSENREQAKRGGIIGQAAGSGGEQVLAHLAVAVREEWDEPMDEREKLGL